VTIFTAAFLLFQVQPIIAKYILPWFGGGPSVWTTAMLFFQTALLGGYAYAHFSIRYLRPRGQAALHLALLVIGLVLLPITPAAGWKPEGANIPTLQIGVYSVALFICCMACHGELARLKPHPRYLTSYFLGIAAGGVLGGFLVGVVAPFVFNLFFELHLGLLACCALVLVAISRDQRAAFYRGRPRWAWGAIGVSYVGLAVALGAHASQSTSFAITSSRSFYGVLRTYEEEIGTDSETRALLDGRIVHGLQYTASNKRRFPTTYYAPPSGIGRTFEAFPGSELRVGLGPD
jgi:hypothetical protein